MIRPYRPTDSRLLAVYHNLIYPERPFTPTAFHHHIQALQKAGGSVWVIEDGKTAVGYAAVAPLPGLPGMTELEGFIAPTYQRHGLGSQLLSYLITQLSPAVHQLSCLVSSLETPTARFLRFHHFFPEHAEITLQLPLPPLTSVPLAPLQIPPLTFRHYHKAKTVQLFCALYHQSFAGLPWYQPYTLSEVKNTLQDPTDILFLLAGEKTIGFAWLHQSGDIEPVGIIPEEQGKGNGRFLLLTALQRLTRRGCSHATITVWETNTPALHLYKSLGFQPVETRYYLAYNSLRHS